jgi:hypothetical protein
MFYAELLTALVEGLEKTFTADYETVDFRNLHVSLEYPNDPAHYPGIWIDFDFTTPLTPAGIAHVEYTDPIDIGGGHMRFGQFTRWQFEGNVTFTIGTFSSLTRARLFDELVKVLGFGRTEIAEHGYEKNPFYAFLDDNDLIALIVASDSIAVHGMTANEGTPWDTDDMIYEATMAVPCRGEFVSEPSGQLVPLSAVEITALADGEVDQVTTP